MPKTIFPKEQQEVGEYLSSIKGESISYPQLFEAIAQTIPFSQCVIVTSLPRGTLQIAQPPNVPEALLKSYVKDFHAFDRPTWTAIAQGKAVRAVDCWGPGEYETSRYVREFLAPNGLKYAAAAPLTAPVMNGYPGSLTLFRSADLGRFSD